MIVPLVVFLISLLSVAVGSNILAPLRSSIVWWWIIALALFSWIASFIIIWAMTQPIKDVVRRAQQYVTLEKMEKDRGRMIEIYKLIEQLTEYVRVHGGKGNKTELMKSIESLDYIIPLGYMSLMVAHEVRNPLNTITGMSELIRQKTTDESQLVYIDMLLDAARKIDIFTHELLDFNNNELNKEFFDIGDIIDDAIHSLGHALDHVTCEFPKPEKLPCLADRTKIYQAVFNVLRNAAEHEKKDGYIRISVSVAGNNREIVIFNKHSVIDKEDLESLFMPFFTKKKGGKGLGLYIAMRNMRLHGGNITVQSGADGTSFILTLPLPASNEAEGMAPEGKKINTDTA